MPAMPRVEVVGDATMMGEWLGPAIWTGDEIDLDALTAYAARLPRGTRLLLDIERGGIWNADARKGSVEGFVKRAVAMIDAVHTADNDIAVAFYDSFREDFFPLVNGGAALTALRDANDALSEVVDASDWHAGKCYLIPQIRAADIQRVINAYADETLRTARGKPAYLLLSGTAYNPPRTLTAAERKAQAAAVASRTDLNGVIWWSERQYAASVRAAADELVAVVAASEQ